MLHYPRNRS